MTADFAHLDALRSSLSHKHARLAAARKPDEIASRKVMVAQIEKEIAGEIASLARRGIVERRSNHERRQIAVLRCRRRPRGAQGEAAEGREMTITPEQVRAARQLLGWSCAKLAGRVGVSEKTIMAFEAGDPWAPRSSPISPRWIRARLESAGVEFIAENGDEPGVRLRQPIFTATRRHGARSIRMKNSATKIELRLSEDLSSQINAYIAAQHQPRPSRSEAIRRLLAVGLGVKAEEPLQDMTDAELLPALRPASANKG